MDSKQVNKNGNAGADGQRHRELISMLRDLVNEKGRAGTARLLGVDRKTVRRAYDSGQLTDHMAGALERLVGGEKEEESAEAPGEESIEERVEQLEEDVAELSESVEALRSQVEGAGAEEEVEGVEDEGVGCSQDSASKGITVREGESMTSSAVPSVEGLDAMRRRMPRREDPELITEHPAEDDPEVYGPAWPLVEEWRRVRDGHAHQGRCLSWLVTQERLLVLELAMLEEHTLTLPPETQPLRGFGRRGQTSWRHKALHDTWKALRRRRMLRWVRRGPDLGHVVGLGREGCGESEDTAVGNQGPDIGSVVEIGGEGLGMRLLSK